MVLLTKVEMNHQVCYQLTVQKPASLMVWGCISVYVVGSFHIWKGTINVEEYIELLEQHMLPSTECLFQGGPRMFQQENAKPHTASITTAWLQRRRVQMLNWPACSPDLSPTENIWHIIKWKKPQDFWGDRILHQATMGQHSSPKGFYTLHDFWSCIRS